MSIATCAVTHTHYLHQEYIRNEGLAIIQKLPASARSGLHYYETVATTHHFQPLPPLPPAAVPGRAYFHCVVTDWSLYLLARTGSQDTKGVVLEVPWLFIKDLGIDAIDSDQVLQPVQGKRFKAHLITAVPQVDLQKLPPSLTQQLQRAGDALSAGATPEAAAEAARGQPWYAKLFKRSPDKGKPVPAAQPATQQSECKPATNAAHSHTSQQQQQQQQSPYIPGTVHHSPTAPYSFTPPHDTADMYTQAYPYPAPHRFQHMPPTEQHAAALQQYGQGGTTRAIGEGIEQGPAPYTQAVHAHPYNRPRPCPPSQAQAVSSPFDYLQQQQQLPAQYPHPYTQPPGNWGAEVRTAPAASAPSQTYVSPARRAYPSPMPAWQPPQPVAPDSTLKPIWSPQPYPQANPFPTYEQQQQAGYFPSAFNPNPWTADPKTHTGLPPPPALDLRSPVLPAVEQPHPDKRWADDIQSGPEAADIVLATYGLTLITCEPRSRLAHYMRRAWLSAHMRLAGALAASSVIERLPGVPAWFSPPASHLLSLLSPYRQAGAPRTWDSTTRLQLVLRHLGLSSAAEAGHHLLGRLFPGSSTNRAPSPLLISALSTRIAHVGSQPRSVHDSMYDPQRDHNQSLLSLLVDQLESGQDPGWTRHQVAAAYQLTEARMLKGGSLWDADDESMMQEVMMAWGLCADHVAKSLCAAFFKSSTTMSYICSRMLAWGALCSMYRPGASQPRTMTAGCQGTASKPAVTPYVQWVLSRNRDLQDAHGRLRSDVTKEMTTPWSGAHTRKPPAPWDSPAPGAKLAGSSAPTGEQQARQSSRPLQTMDSLVIDRASGRVASSEQDQYDFFLNLYNANTWKDGGNCPAGRGGGQPGRPGGWPDKLLRRLGMTSVAGPDLDKTLDTVLVMLEQAHSDDAGDGWKSCRSKPPAVPTRPTLAPSDPLSLSPLPELPYLFALGMGSSGGTADTASNRSNSYHDDPAMQKAVGDAQARLQGTLVGRMLQSEFMTEAYNELDPEASQTTRAQSNWEMLVGRFAASLAWRKLSCMLRWLKCMTAHSQGCPERLTWLSAKRLVANRAQHGAVIKDDDESVLAPRPWTWRSCTELIAGLLPQIKDPLAPQATQHTQVPADKDDLLWWCRIEQSAGSGWLNDLVGVSAHLSSLSGIEAAQGNHIGQPDLMVTACRKLPPQQAHAFCRTLLCHLCCLATHPPRQPANPAHPPGCCPAVLAVEAADASAFQTAELLLLLLNKVPGAAASCHDALDHRLMHILRTPQMSTALAGHDSGPVLSHLVRGLLAEVVDVVAAAHHGSRPASWWVSGLSQGAVQNLGSCVGRHKLPGGLT